MRRFAIGIVTVALVSTVVAGVVAQTTQKPPTTTAKPSPASTQPTREYITEEWITLRGVKAVRVSLDLDEEAKPIIGVDPTSSLELRLRQTGIEVTDNAGVLLAVRLDALKLDEGNQYVWTLRLEVQQLVKLNPFDLTTDKLAFGTIWSRGQFGRTGSARISSLRNTIIESLDPFLNDWLKANPKR